MRNSKALFFPLSLSALAAVTVIAATPRDASACGGCLAAEKENTQVTGHKMILSVSPQQTTLWDQITYSGNPSSFAWVLPIRGKVTVGLSSDALFQALAASTQVTIDSPPLVCPSSNCHNSAAFGDSLSGADEPAPESPNQPSVTVIAQEVVGPYETVQLSSTDPGALDAWLTSHGYNIPTDVDPVIQAYVTEGFDFLALKLVPGQGVDTMRPVRVSSPGASPLLPLRMVAAGTGAITPITLWVLAEGRYQPSTMPTFTVAATDLTWDWDTKSSNYAVVKQQRFTAGGGKSWLVEAAEPTSRYEVQYQLDDLVQSNVAQSGYGDASGNGASTEEQADLAALYGTLDSSSLWVTRISSELSRAALADDLQLGASTDQSMVDRNLQVQKAIGTAPPCPVQAGGCGGVSSGISGTGVSGVGPIHGASCAFSGTTGVSTTLSGLVISAAMAMARRRRARRQG